MILPKYIAVQANLESSGIAFADMKYIEPLLEEMLAGKKITVDIGREILGHKSDVAKTVFNLFQHIGVINVKHQADTNEEIFLLTNFGKYLLENKAPQQSIVQPLTPFFLTWLPFKIFLKFLQQNPGATLNEVRSKLGAQILKHTTDIKKLNLSKTIRRGAYIPFNEMVIGKVLANIGQYLGLVSFEKSSGPYFLSPLGKYVTNSVDLLNFQFKNLDEKLMPMKLALLDFIDRGSTNIITFGRKEKLMQIKEFYKVIEPNLPSDMILNIAYNVSNFDAMISTDSAFWSFTRKFSNITYDQIKVLEFNSKIMDFIEI